MSQGGKDRIDVAVIDGNQYPLTEGHNVTDGAEVKLTKVEKRYPQWWQADQVPRRAC